MSSRTKGTKEGRKRKAIRTKGREGEGGEGGGRKEARPAKGSSTWPRSAPIRIYGTQGVVLVVMLVAVLLVVV